MEAVYKVSGEHVETRPSAAGPWDATLQHGAAPAALIAWAAEALESDVPMRVSRLTIDLLRPVPVAPLELHSEIIRQGKKIQVTAVRLRCNGAEVARASILKVRLSSPALNENMCNVELDVSAPEEARARTGGRTIDSPFLRGVASCDAVRRYGPAQSSATWFRVDQPIVEGHAVSPLMRAAVAADFCNGVSSKLSAKEWSFINADLTLTVARPAIGDWILLDAETWLGNDGGGSAMARLGDAKGYFGRAVQSVLIERR